MGKKHVIKKTEEELIKETEQVEKKVSKSENVKKSKKGIDEANIYIFSSYNNTIITVADINGNVLSWKSAGSIGFKGTKKGTSFAASRVGETVSSILKKMGIEKVHIFVKGIGSGRDSSIRSLAAHDLQILSIKDATPIPHNGCRPKKPRRV